MARKTHKKSLQEYMEENGIGVGDPDDDEESVVAPIVQETPRLVTRALRTEHLQPLIDLVFSVFSFICSCSLSRGYRYGI
jgi:hypothetical protein